MNSGRILHAPRLSGPHFFGTLVVAYIICSILLGFENEKKSQKKIIKNFDTKSSNLFYRQLEQYIFSITWFIMVEKSRLGLSLGKRRKNFRHGNSVFFWRK